MATVALDQYLAKLFELIVDDHDEIKLNAGRADFGLFSIYAENKNPGLHFYQVNEAELLFAVGGKVALTVDGQATLIDQASVLLLQAGSSYQVGEQMGEATLLKARFGSNFRYQAFFKDLAGKTDPELAVINKLSKQLEKDKYLFFTDKIESTKLLGEIVQAYLGEELFVKSLVKAKLTLAFVLLCQKRKQGLTGKDGRIKFSETALTEYIDQHFAKVTLGDAAAYFGFNPNYFSNMVKQKTGRSFVEHVDERRMQEAKVLLAKPDVSLKEIISLVGFSSKSFFYKRFNEYYHMTPAAMRSELFRQANIHLK